MPKLTDELDVLFRASNSGLWIVTSDPAEVEREIVSLVRKQTEDTSDHNGPWELFRWDARQGVKPLYTPRPTSVPNDKGPTAALDMLEQFSRNEAVTSHAIILHNYHKFFNLPNIVQGLGDLLQQGKQTRCFGIVVAPLVAIPLELRTYFTPLVHDLPDRQELRSILQELLLDGPLEKTEIPDAIVDAAAGLSRYEAENAFTLSMVRENKLTPRPIWEYKAATLAKGGVLTLHKGHETFDSIGGLQSIKDFCMKCLTPREGRRSVAKGVIALGVPGAGKSAFAKALGNMTNRPTGIVDIAGLLSRYVGESETNLKMVLSTLEAMSPCIGFLDEVEKGLAGVGSGLDSGVMDRIFGTLLSWRQDTKADVFLVLTANDVSKMPAPLLRAGRTNAIFFFDLPNRAEKDTIWQLYLKHYGIDQGDTPLPDDTDWTGAEVRNCCELADLLGISLAEAAKMVVPIATTQAGQIEDLRAWAENRALSASFPGVYKQAASDKKPARRRNIKPNNFRDN